MMKKDPEYSLPDIHEIYARMRAVGLEAVTMEQLSYGKWHLIQARKAIPS